MIFFDLFKGKKIKFLYLLLLVFSLCLFPSFCLGTVPTKVLFVGEDLYVVTSASKHPEAPDVAPAVVDIFDRKQIEDYGVRTLGEALSMSPGFFMAKREWGVQPFFRGIPDSFLFLYDSVPMTSDSTKSIFPLDEELSLDFVKQIEIIKGPASVIWGPDAFAGLVNVVPLTGKDLDGIDLKIRTGSPDKEAHATLSMGKNFGVWDGFIAFSATKRESFADEYTVLKCTSSHPCGDQYTIGKEKLDDSKYFETVFNLSWKSWLKLSGRWSTFTNRYVIGEIDSEKYWPAKKKLPFRFIKLSADKEFGSYNIHASGYYSKIPYEEQLVDISWSSNSHIYYGELFIDKQFWDSSALFTFGASYRYNKITGAVISKSYLPDYLQPGNPIFTPIINQEDFNTSLYSIYGQIRKHWKHFELWAGLRFDDHSQYENTLSYNLGVRWWPNKTWNAKFLAGTAYRTPYNTQLVNRTDLKPEKISNISLYVEYRPFKNLTFEITGFWNHIKRHVSEDPTGGLSKAGSQDIYGIESTIKWSPVYWFSFWFNGTFFNNFGDKEEYKVLDYIIIEPDGTFKPFYSEWETPFETGPKNICNIGLELRPVPRLIFSGRINYQSSSYTYYNKGSYKFKSDSNWLLDLNLKYKDIFVRGLDAQVSFKNVLDEKSKLPGKYGPVTTDPFAVYFSLHFKY